MFIIYIGITAKLIYPLKGDTGNMPRERMIGMKKHYKLMQINLCLFDEGGAAAPETGTAPEQTASTQADNGNQQTETQTEVNGSNSEGEQQAVDLEAQFKELVTGEYKDVFNRHVQNMIKDRLKNTKQETAQYQRQVQDANMSLLPLWQRYGVQEGDYKGLAAAVQNDRQYIETAAEELNMSPEMYMQYQQMQYENARLNRINQDVYAREQAAKKYSEWQGQAEALRAEFPEFDLDVEAETNPQFAELLRAGIPVEHAYKTVHMKEITEKAAKEAAEKAKQNTINAVKNSQARPTENGVNGQQAVHTKIDVSKLTPEQINEYAERARRGERITFS